MTNTEPVVPAVVRATEAETLAGPAGAIVLLLDSSDTGGALSTQRVRLHEGADGAAPHHHKRSTELFFVAAGEAQLLTGETILSLGTGDAAPVGPGLTHAFAAAPGRDTDLLIVITPGVERFDYFRRLGEVMAGRWPADALIAEQERFDTYFDDSPRWARRQDRG